MNSTIEQKFACNTIQFDNFSKYKEKGKSERLAQADCKADAEIQKTESTRSVPDYREPDGSQGDSVVPDNSSAIQQPVNDLVSPQQAEHQNRLSLRRHKRLKTHPGASNHKDGMLQEDIMKPSKVAAKAKEGHRKTASVSGRVTRGAQYYNMPTFKKLRETKEMAENAMKVCLLERKICSTSRYVRS